MVELINSFPDFSGSFGEKRAAQAFKLTRGRNSSIRQVKQQAARACTNKELPASKELNIVEAKEQKKTAGICWRIITTHPVTINEQAMQIIEWYKHRWYIEQIHRY